MEIIFRGKHSNTDTFVGTCSKCKTKVRFNRSEAKQSNDQKGGFLIYVQCPVCNYAIYGDLEK